MRKESIIAIVFGLVLGSTVAFFILFKNKDQQMDKVKTITSVNSLSPTIVQNMPSQLLSIDSPNDAEIFKTNSITIKGKATKDSLLVAESPIKDVTMKLDKDQFTFNFPLALGENTIHITVYPSDKQSGVQEKVLKIYYLEEQ